MLKSQYKLANSMVGVLVVTVITFVIVSPTLAYSFLGGRWASFPRSYYIDGTLYVSEIGSAVSSWSYYTGGKIKLNRTYSAGYENIRILPGNYGFTPWDAGTYLFPGSTANPYNYAQVQLNSYFFSTYTYSMRQHVTAHELGHAIGLNHEDSGNCLLMNSGGFCAVYPRADDVNGARARYP